MRAGSDLKSAQVLRIINKDLFFEDLYFLLFLSSPLSASAALKVKTLKNFRFVREPWHMKALKASGFGNL